MTRRSQGLLCVASVASLLGALLAIAPPARASTPTVEFLTPDGGEVYTGGSVARISWNQSHGGDSGLRAAIAYSLDGGATYPYFITSQWFPAGRPVYDWTTPRIDRTTVRVRVCAVGSDYDRGCLSSAGDFAITATPPWVAILSPSRSALNVSHDSPIVVHLQDIDTPTVFWSITPSIPLTPTWTSNNTLLTLSHVSPFLLCTGYTVYLYAWDLGGQNRSVSWSFYTQCGGPFILYTSPADGTVDVPLTAPIVVGFSHRMDPPTVTVTISPSLSLIPSWSANNTVLTLSHTAPFPCCTTITVQLQGHDVFGDALLGNNTWSFSTVGTSPYIAATNPGDGATSVSLDANVIASFSEQMNESSVEWTMNPYVRLTPAWATGYDLWLLPRETIERYNVSMNPDYYPGGDFSAWMCSQVPPNQIVLMPVGVVSIRSVQAYIWSPNSSDDLDLQVWLDANDNGVCEPTIDVLLCQSLGPGATESCTTSTADGTKRIFVQIGPYAPGSDMYNANIQDSWRYQPCALYTANVTQGWDPDGNPLVPGPVPNPWSFTTDCGMPRILSTIPSSAGANVSLTAPLSVTFSESMNTSSVGVTLSPPVGNISLSWPSGSSLLVLHDPLAPCTTYTVNVTGRDPDGNALVPGPVPNPWSFTTVCPRPYIVSTNPPDASQGILRDAAVVIAFSEAMNASSVAASFAPTVPGVTPSWSGSDTVLTLSHLPFQRCAWYSVTVSGESAIGLPLVAGPSPNPWAFQVSCATIAATLMAPLGGESWTGGTGHPVSLQVYNGLPTEQSIRVDVAYRYAGGASGGLVAWQNLTVPPGSSVPWQAVWTTPLVDAADVVMNLTATAFPAGDVAWSQSPAFEIDSTPPSVVTATPSGGHAPVDPVVDIRFSEPMNVATSGLPVVVPTVAMSATWSPARDSLQIVLTGTSPCTSYAVSLGAPPGGGMYDDSDPGNPLPSYAWSFTTQCMPSVMVLVPVGGEDWTGGTAHTVSWTSDDADDPRLTVTFLLSVDNGTTFAPFGVPTGYPIGTDALSWALPLVDTAAAVLRIVVADSDGNTASDDGPPFTIDSTPPDILTSYPLDGESGFKTTRAIWFVFTERVDRAAFLASFSIAPDPGGLAFTWSEISGADVLTVDHAPLKSRTDYAVTFGTAAKDDSDPGNHPPVPLVVRFSTQPPPNVNPPVAKAVGKNQVQVGEPATFDGLGSTGNISAYVWRIVDNQGRLVNVLVGAVVTTTFQQNGRYSVTLVVRDVNGLTDDDTLEIAVTSNPHADAYLLAGGALFAAALIATTESGKYGLFGWVLFPLYVRRKRNEALEHQTRGMILGYVMVHPGDTYTDIKRNLMLSNGTLSYHLRVMEREGLVRSRPRGPHKLFYPLGVRVPEDGGGLHEIQMRMLGAVREVPGLAVKDIAGALGITSQHALYHLRSLAAKGLIRLEKHGFNLRCYAEEQPKAPAP